MEQATQNGPVPQTPTRRTAQEHEYGPGMLAPDSEQHPQAEIPTGSPFTLIAGAPMTPAPPVFPQLAWPIMLPFPITPSLAITPQYQAQAAQSATEDR
jgi:hypothetical protein